MTCQRHAKMSGFIMVKSSLGNSYGEEKDYVFSMDDLQVVCILISSSSVQLPLSLPPADYLSS